MTDKPKTPELPDPLPASDDREGLAALAKLGIFVDAPNEWPAAVPIRYGDDGGA